MGRPEVEQRSISFELSKANTEFEEYKVIPTSPQEISADRLFSLLKDDAWTLHAMEGTLRDWLNCHLLRHRSFSESVCSLLSAKLSLAEIRETDLYADLVSVASRDLLTQTENDLMAVIERDPCTRNLANAFFFGSLLINC